MYVSNVRNIVDLAFSYFVYTFEKIAPFSKVVDNTFAGSNWVGNFLQLT